jgi:hypothetical protein
VAGGATASSGARDSTYRAEKTAQRGLLPSRRCDDRTTDGGADTTRMTGRDDFEMEIFGNPQATQGVLVEDDWGDDRLQATAELIIGDDRPVCGIFSGGQRNLQELRFVT